MGKLRILAYGLVVLVGVWVFESAVVGAQIKSQDPRIALADDCDPITFNTVFGAGTWLGRGDCTVGDFLAALLSPLIDNNRAFVGHSAWRFEPAYLGIRAGQTVRVTNNGGEVHTFTKVVNFGGGTVGLLNGADVARAPECPANFNDLELVAPGSTVQVKGLSAGANKFICCIHPWMRAIVDVD